MGIPCYFVSLIRKYPELMVDLERKGEAVDIFYLDSNSIVYDALREMDVTKEDADGSVIEAVLAKLACEASHAVVLEVLDWRRRR